MYNTAFGYLNVTHNCVTLPQKSIAVSRQKTEASCAKIRHFLHFQ